jgi:hypothetical protein
VSGFGCDGGGAVWGKRCRSEPQQPVVGVGWEGCGKCERAKLPGWTQERRVAWERAQPRHETSGDGIGGQRSVDSDLGWLQGWRFREHGTRVAREADKWVLFGGGPLWH